MGRESRSRIYIRGEAKILAAALNVFCDAGFKGATLEAIATHAEMSQPNLHNYFETKLELYLRTLDTILNV